MSSDNKRSMDREGSPVSKRPRCGNPTDHDLTRAPLSPTDFDRHDNHRKNEPLDYPPPSPGFTQGGNRSEFHVHDEQLPLLPPPSKPGDTRGPLLPVPLPLPPPRPGDTRGPLLPDPYPPPPQWTPQNDYRSPTGLQPPPRPGDTRGPPPAGPYPPPPRWTPENDYRSLCINGIPSNVPDQVLRECLIDNYERFGEMNVKITNSDDQRVAYLNFRYPEDAREALVKGVKYLFERELKINPVFNQPRQNISPSRSVPSSGVSIPPPEPFYHSRQSLPPYDRQYLPTNGSQYSGNDDYKTDASKSGSLTLDADRKNEKFPCHLDHVDPEYDDKATRTLFVGNLDVNILDYDLRNIFGRFGLVENVVIKRSVRSNGYSYAFVKYINLECAHLAKVEMSGKYIGRLQCTIDYSKVTPTTVIWVESIGQWVTVETLEREFDRFGAIQHIEWPRNKNFAYVIYDSIEAAQAACQQMRGFPFGGPDKRLRFDFGEKDNITRSHSLPDYHYPPPNDAYGPPERAPEPWRDIPRLPESTDRLRDYRAPPPPPDPYLDGGRGTDVYAYDHNGNSRRERTSDYTNPSYFSQRAPERGRDYRDERGQSREFRDDRDQSRDENRHSDRRDYRAASPHEDYISTHCRSLVDLSKMLPVAWNGALVLKNSAFATSMHVVSGDGKLVDTLMRDPTSTERPVLKITQYLGLDQPNLDYVSRCVGEAGSHGHCIFLAMQSSLPNFEESVSIQQQPLKNLVTYLKQKDSAGVISLPPVTISGKKDIGVLHAFPPCDFGFHFLKNRASKLPPESKKEDHLVIVVLNGTS